MNNEKIKQKDAGYKLVVRLQERTLNIIMVYSNYLTLREVEAKIGEAREINNLYNTLVNSFMRVIALDLWIVLGEKKDTHYVKLLNHDSLTPRKGTKLLKNDSLTSSMNKILGNAQSQIASVKETMLKDLLCKISGIRSDEFDKDLFILGKYRNNHGAHYGNHDGTDKTPIFLNLTRFASSLHFLVHCGIKHRMNSTCVTTITLTPSDNYF